MIINVPAYNVSILSQSVGKDNAGGLGYGASWLARATSNGRGPWWNAGSPQMHAAITNERLSEWGLKSLRQMQREVL